MTDSDAAISAKSGSKVLGSWAMPITTCSRPAAGGAGAAATCAGPTAAAASRRIDATFRIIRVPFAVWGRASLKLLIG
jgi:hypothetical protein